jgi:hypothetical protein
MTDGDHLRDHAHAPREHGRAPHAQVTDQGADVSAIGHASLAVGVARRLVAGLPLRPAEVLALQASAGNRAVARVLRSRQGAAAGLAMREPLRAGGWLHRTPAAAPGRPRDRGPADEAAWVPELSAAGLAATVQPPTVAAKGSGFPAREAAVTLLLRQPRTPPGPPPPAALLSPQAAATAAAETMRRYDEDSIRFIKLLVGRPPDANFTAVDAETLAQNQRSLGIAGTGKVDEAFLNFLLSKTTTPAAAMRSQMIHLVIDHAGLNVSDALSPSTPTRRSRAPSIGRRAASARYESGARDSPATGRWSPRSGRNSRAGPRRRRPQRHSRRQP